MVSPIQIYGLVIVGRTLNKSAAEKYPDKLSCSCHVFMFDMWIDHVDMGTKAGKQDGPCLILMAYQSPPPP